MKTFKQLVAEHEELVNEIMPWDLEGKLAKQEKPLLVDIREADEFTAMHIQNSINVPRGLLEAACDYNYSETVPELVQARDREVVVICRSGNRSVLAAHTMQQMGYQHVMSLKTGLKGWNDFEQTLISEKQEKIDIDAAEQFLNPEIKAQQLSTK